MKQINLWRVQQNEKSELVVDAVPSLAETQTEKHLEDLLVASPELLLPGLTLVGRQTPTQGGPLDLLGVDQDGRLVVFELKRGTLTREAVAQVLDYASYLHELEHEQLCRHIEDRSGLQGIPKIEDFDAWHSEQYSGASERLEDRPRMILVGLGVDDRARRMTEFLADSSLDISLITFYAFELDGQTLLARQTEVASRIDRTTSQKYNRETNWQILQEKMAAGGVNELFEEIRKVVKACMPNRTYEWPNRSTLAFSLPGHTETGSPSNYVYVSLVIDPKQSHRVGVAIMERAWQLVKDKFESFQSDVSDKLQIDDYWSGYCMWITQQDWVAQKSQISDLLTCLSERWQEQGTTPNAEESQLDKSNG